MKDVKKDKEKERRKEKHASRYRFCKFSEQTYANFSIRNRKGCKNVHDKHFISLENDNFDFQHLKQKRKFCKKEAFVSARARK